MVATFVSRPIAFPTAVITVAENDDSRPNPGRFILASNWLIDFIQLDVTLLIVWIGVHFGLKPLLALRRQIEARSARELARSIPRRFRPKCGRWSMR